MAAQEKETPSILGLGHGASSDPNAWRPSQARAKDSGLSPHPAQDQRSLEPLCASAAPLENRGAAWRPSQANEERLSSLQPSRRRRIGLPRGTRLVLTFVFFVGAAYFFLRLWLMPEAGVLRPALAIAAAIIVLLFVSAIAGAVARKRRHKSADEKSTLRL